MDTINPWLDPSAVRQLAEQLLRPIEPAKINTPPPGFDSSFVGFTDDQIIDPTAARFHSFRDWLAQHFQAKDIFILDHAGKIIFDETSHGRLHFMARSFINASSIPSNIHVKISSSAVLEVIPCETPNGLIILGTLLPKSLAPEQVKIITDVLLQAASPS